MSKFVEVMLGERFYLYPTVIDAFNSGVQISISGYNIIEGALSVNDLNNELYIKGNWSEIVALGPLFIKSVLYVLSTVFG